jgi:hypothetical protein
LRIISLGKSHAPHVRRGLNRWDELQRSVTDTNQADDRAGDDAEPLLANDDGPDENVDCGD